MNAIPADSRNAGPLDKPGVFRTINNRPILWKALLFTHECEGADVHPGVRLIWTRCEIDVPAGKAFLAGDNDKVDCPRCLSLHKTLVSARTGSDEVWQ